MSIKIAVPGLTWDDDPLNHLSVTAAPIPGGFEIRFTAMYESPPLTFETLKGLGGHFGTDRIDVDHISEGGFDSYDYGSCYGHAIQVYGATRNIPVFTETAHD